MLTIVSQCCLRVFNSSNMKFNFQHTTHITHLLSASHHHHHLQEHRLLERWREMASTNTPTLRPLLLQIVVHCSDVVPATACACVDRRVKQLHCRDSASLAAAARQRRRDVIAGGVTRANATHKRASSSVGGSHASFSAGGGTLKTTSEPASAATDWTGLDRAR